MSLRRLWHKLFGAAPTPEDDNQRRLTDALRPPDVDDSLQQNLQTMRTELDKLEALCTTEIRAVALSRQFEHPPQQMGHEIPELHMANPPTDIIQ